jgi:hypothetical protein
MKRDNNLASRLPSIFTRAIAVLVSLLLSGILLSSCGGGTISESEAKKQLDDLLRQAEPTFHVNGQLADDDVVERWMQNGSKAGYLTCRRKTLGKQKVIIFFATEKAKPFIAQRSAYRWQYENDIYPLESYDFKSGTIESKIVSIAVPATDSKGRFVCNVKYRIKFNPTDLYTIFEQENAYFSIPGKWDARTNEDLESVFVKMQNGEWQLER